MARVERIGCVIVVGGSGGIGKAIVEKYCRAHQRVVVVDRKKSEIGSSTSVVHIAADVTTIADIKQVATELDSSGLVVQHLISLAGGATNFEQSDNLRDTLDENIDNQIRLNLTSHLLLVKYLIENSASLNDEAGDRSVVFISSINAIRSFAQPVYSAAKAGLLGATIALAGTLAPRVRVNVIIPGTVLTPRIGKPPKDFGPYLQKTLLGRFATAEDIAECCYFLTHQCTSITGQQLTVDAGQSVRVLPRALGRGGLGTA